MGPGLGGQSTGVLKDVTCRASRVGDCFAAVSKAFTLGQRRTRSASELLLRRLLMANRAVQYTFSTNIHGELGCMKAVRELPGVVVVRCDHRLYCLVERWPLKESGLENVHP